MPHLALFIDGRAQFAEIAARSGFIKKLFENHACDQFIAAFRQMQAVNRERLFFRGCFRIQFLHLVARSDFGHGGGVEQNIFVVFARIRKIRVLMPFICDRREQHNAWRAFARIIFAFGLFDPVFQIGFKFLQSFRSLE